MSKWSMRFGQFCHFSPILKPFESRSSWFQFCYHFYPKSKSSQIFQLKSIFLSFSSLLIKGKIL
ncbi:hypothetical protein Hanom_Chr03g00192231 [Helianthus anomalus]